MWKIMQKCFPLWKIKNDLMKIHFYADKWYRLNCCCSSVNGNTIFGRDYFELITKD